MATVEIRPMPQSWRKIPVHFRPGHPPIFPGDPPADDDIELVRELFKALDPESQEWYRRGSSGWLFGL